MNRLFKFNFLSFNVELNDSLICIIPQFKRILDNDKEPSKSHAIDIFTYIFLICDFSSPLENYEEEERIKEALRYTKLSKAEVDETMVKLAIEEYLTIQYKSSLTLKSLRASKKGLATFEKYIESIDFTKISKNGALVNNPKDFIASIQNLNQMHDAISKLEKRTEQELAANNSIRGNRELGDKEMFNGAGINNKWQESKGSIEDDGSDYNIHVHKFDTTKQEINTFDEIKNSKISDFIEFENENEE